MNGNELSVGHIMMLVAVVSIPASFLTAIALFLLQRIFGAGDKSGTDIAALKDKVHALELANAESQNSTREHVADRYATREDVRQLQAVIQTAIENMNVRMSEYTSAVTAMLGPISEQLGVNAVRTGRHP